MGIVCTDALHAGHSPVVAVYEIIGLVQLIEESAPDVTIINIRNPNRDATSVMFEDVYFVGY
jgi:AmiR/NasT family two-component response regulator